jgi:two-component system sensor histidine kinase KdpD
MLREGQRLRARGMDVIIGRVQAYNRPRTLEAIGSLEIVPSQWIAHRGVTVEEMDIDAILTRRPQLVLVDELAHTNVAGSRHRKRYQDVLELRATGISVITTLNVQQLASLQDTVRLVAGVAVSETLPDWVLDSADEIEMVDEAPEVLQKRVRRGNVLPPEQIEGALQGYFRTDTLSALRELTQRYVGERRRLNDTRAVVAVDGQPHTETVLVCLPSNDQAQALLRRGMRMADLLEARLVVVHVSRPGLGVSADESRGHQEATRALHLARAFGAETYTTTSSKVAEALVQHVRETGATQVVLGESSHSRLHELFRGSVLREVLRATRDVDVHIVRRPGP